MENKQNFVIKNGVLKKYNGPGGEVTIPEGVTVIGDSAFEDCTGLTSVTIPEGVTEIGWEAFKGCENLTSVTIPEGVTEIRWAAFKGCENLTSVTIPAGVTEIRGLAFTGCHKLADEHGMVIVNGILSVYIGPGGDVIIPEGVTKIGNLAFHYCANLTSVTIPEGVTEIGWAAFKGCAKLTRVTIPEGVTEIGPGAFSGCAKLTSVTIPESVKVIDKSAFDFCRPALQAIHIPLKNFNSADKPGACAGFAKVYLDGTELDEQTKADYLQYIKRQRKRLFPMTFQHNELLQVMLAEKMLTRQDIELLLEEYKKRNNFAAKAAVLDYASRNLKPVDPVKDLEVFQATGVMRVGEAKKRFYYKKREDGNGLTITAYIGDETEVVIPRIIGKTPVTEIDDEAFRFYEELQCYEGMTINLTSVTIPGSVTEIAASIFEGCTGLTSITIPESVTLIGDCAFSDCPNLTIHAPAGSYAERYARENDIPFEATAE